MPQKTDSGKSEDQLPWRLWPESGRTEHVQVRLQAAQKDEKAELLLEIPASGETEFSV